MSDRGKPLVLVADHRDSSRVVLARALRDAGLDVETARDGSRALEVAVLEQPELIVFESSNPLIDGRRFVDILRSNPRTEDTPAIITGSDADAFGHGLGLRVSFVQWPYDVDEVVRLIQDVLGRAQAAREVTRADVRTEGALGEIGLIDLLQIFVMNRKSGRLRLNQGPLKGEVLFREGELWHAHLGSAEGIKALYRFLTWTHGRFEYVPGTVDVRRTIKGTPEEVMMEGARQADELGRMNRARLDAHVQLLVAREDLPAPQHRVTQEVIELLGFYDTVSEVLDHSTHTDFEVQRALHLLAEKGVVQISSAAPVGDAQAPLVDVDVLARLFSQARQPLSVSTEPPVWKVVVLARNRRALQRFLGPFGRLPGFDVDTAFFASSGGEVPPIGAAARLRLGDKHELLFVACPSAEIYRPLLGLFVDRALGVVVVDWTGAESLAALVREALPVEAVPVDLATFAPEGAAPDATMARELVQQIVHRAAS